MSKQFREFITKYGPIAIGTQIGISLSWLGATYALVKWGLDYNAIAAKVGFDFQAFQKKMADKSNKNPMSNTVTGEQAESNVKTTTEKAERVEGFDIQEAITEEITKDIENGKVKMLSDFAIAYILYKAMAPIRIPIIFGMIPVVAKVLRRAPKV